MHDKLALVIQISLYNARRRPKCDQILKYKVAQMFPKVAHKNNYSSFNLEVMLFTSGQKSPYNLATFWR